MGFHHIPVMLTEVLEYMQPRPGGVYADGTLGGGGHAEAIMQRILPGGRLIGIDRDPAAIQAASERLQAYGSAFIPIHGHHGSILDILKDMQVEGLDGMLMDLGVSSHQLDTPRRGFTYHEDVPLDMRMDTTQTFSAQQVVNEYSVEELSRVIWEYGEERWANRIAAFIAKSRPLQTTGQLVETIKAAVPAGARREGPHPARRTFQAIRIEVNGELKDLAEAVERGAAALKPGGRLLVITFHSLEDRIVKNTFRTLADPCTCPKQFPLCGCGRKPTVRLMTRKPVLPTPGEQEANPRSRSAKLRVAEGLEGRETNSA